MYIVYVHTNNASSKWNFFGNHCSKNARQASLLNDLDEELNPCEGAEDVAHCPNGLASNLLSQQVAQLSA